MTPSTNRSDWQKYLDRKTDNIGFLTRLGVFRDLTPAEIERAALVEAESWQKSKGKKHYSTSAEYSISRAPSFTNNEVTIPDPQWLTRKQRAINAYIATEIKLVGAFENSNIDLTPYQKSKWQKIIDFMFRPFKRKTNEEKVRLSYAEIQEIFRNED